MLYVRCVNFVESFCSQADWAPNKGIKENLPDFKDKWDKQNGVTYIPWADCAKLNLNVIKEGGMFDEETMPPTQK